MNYTVNDVALWMVILVIAYAFFLCIVKGRNWWRDRMGYDPLERWRKKRQQGG
jgi:hypothetical protein